MADLGSNWERESLGGGVYRQTIGLRPTAYLDKGIYRRIVNDFVSGDENFPHIVTAAPMMVSCGADGKRRIHPTREIDRYIEIGAPYIKPAATWQKVNLGAASRVKNRLQWTTANAIVAIETAGHFAKLGILLRNGWQPPNGQFAFPVGLQGLTRQGANLLADGVLVAKLRPPHVEDFDNPDDKRAIDWQFVKVGEQNYILFTLPDLTGMSKPLVDPTVTLQPAAAAGKDTLILEAIPTNGYGTRPDFYAGRTSGAGTRNRSLLQFDLSSIPASANVSAATLTLYCEGETSTTDRNVAIHRGLAAWTEPDTDGAPPTNSGSTWSHQIYNTTVWPGGAGGAAGTDYTALATATTLITAPTAAYTWNGLADAAVWVANAASNLGWWVIGDEVNTSTRKFFTASDGATAANRPKLVITYTLPRGGFGLLTLVPGLP